MSVDHDLLADYVGGALEGTPEQERIADLIAASPEWGRAAYELTAALHGVRHDLDVLRETAEPMPEDVAARFEGLFDGPKRDPLEPRVVTPRSGKAGHARIRGWKRWAVPVGIAAAAAGLYAVGQLPSIIAPTMNDSAGTNSTQLSAEAPAAAPPMPVPTAVTWRMYDRSNLAGALTASTYGGATADQELRTAEKGVDSAGAVPGPLQRLTDPVARQQCLNAVTAVLPGRVDFVEYAYFEGSPALVITITSTNGQWRFVAGGNCGLLGPDEKFQTPPK